jgi:hypothetical protein
MFFSSAITVEYIAAKLRDMDGVKACDEIIRMALNNVTFNLDYNCCDSDELKESCENTPMPDKLFSSIFAHHVY